MFWDVQSKLRTERISNEVILEIAINDVRSQTSEVSLGLQKPFDQALADAEKTMKIVQSAFSRKGGKAPKRDALQALIQEIVIQRPDSRRLKSRLHLAKERSSSKQKFPPEQSARLTGPDGRRPGGDRNPAPVKAARGFGRICLLRPTR
jgi:hypothetical protein